MSSQIKEKASGMLESLDGQQEVLKSVKRRTMEFLNVLGVAGSVMRLIER